MDRPSLRNGCLAALLILAVAVLPSGGCRTLATTAAYLIRGTDIQAEFKGLKEKRIAVVCRPVDKRLDQIELEIRPWRQRSHMHDHVRLDADGALTPVEEIAPLEIAGQVG